jgi:allophanate hydrolase subunit 2
MAGQPVEQRIHPRKLRPEYPTRLRVRVLPGPEFEAFSPYAIGYFFSRGYRLTADSNRMGYRLDATIIDFRPAREVISSGIIPGTIQVTNSGQPIILMADAQTTGGYFRLANVISADMDRLAQLKPGDEVWFSLVHLEEAYEM